MKAALITTEHRGVFFGYIDPEHKDRKVITIERCRNCIYWSGAKGFLGLASDGPGEGSKIGPEAPEVTLQGVTCVAIVSESAEGVWRDYPVNS